MKGVFCGVVELEGSGELVEGCSFAVGLVGCSREQVASKAYFVLMGSGELMEECF